MAMMMFSLSINALARQCVLILLIFSAVVQALPVEDITLGENAVIDQAGLLSELEKNTLDLSLRRWHQQGIMQGAVVIVDSTEGVPIFDYAMAIAERWQLGSAEEDNGLLLLVAAQDRNLYLLTGYGLEGALPDISVKRIIDEDITPAFKQANYAQGIERGLQAAVTRLSADPNQRQLMIMADNAAQQGTSYHSSDGEEDSIAGILAMPILLICAYLARIIGKVFAALLGATVIFILGSFVIGSNILFSAMIAGIFLIVFLVPSDNSRRGIGGGNYSGGRSGGYSGGGGGFGGGGAGGSW